ncbi:NUDIX hydrolase family protein [Magnetospirillum sp. UT-4]|uniref:NUDIX hydrolase n=1 Tax=Magnetospirillum sp. UT-4 TaxID=2681467 RepID=UPI00137EE060|nr:DUF4743 domain-containing protein [Magnetospirillum sp. UT-4]CAA7624402.1 NTP pyrophosphohydrolase including oxidative damage repair enzyme [Magnetospirillum sp. UT-4]
MAFLDHIAACNAHDIGKFRPFMAERRQVGWVRHDVAGHLSAFPATFRVSEEAVTLHPGLATPEARSVAIDAACRDLAAAWGTPGPKGERYDIAPGWGEPSLFTVDRAHVALFGVRAYGIHVNGVVRRADGLHLWIGKRAWDKAVAPGKLDNMIAGGQPAGLTLMDNLVKEAAEEADLPEALARTARPVGAVSYCMEDGWGLKPDTMFCFDLELPEDFVPRNTDGEIEDFRLMPVAEVKERVRSGDDFKFNVNLVLLDFMLRHGVLTPDGEPDYLAVVAGLRKGW